MWVKTRVENPRLNSFVADAAVRREPLLSRVTTGRKPLKRYQRDGPDQTRLARRPARRREQPVRPGVLAFTRGHIRVVELLPIHAAPIQINDPIGHQIRYGDFQRVLPLEQFCRYADSISRIDQHAQFIAVELDAGAFGDPAQIERPVAAIRPTPLPTPLHGERDRIDGRAREALHGLALEISP